MISIGIPVLNNYKGLYELLNSIQENHYEELEKVIVINNGKEEITVSEELRKSIRLLVITPDRNIGVAASWNKIFSFTSGIRFIMNDDVLLGKTFLEEATKRLDPDKVCYFSSSVGAPNSFSCFSISESVINKVGLFDESISPNYAYFEDNDYHRRMDLLGIELKLVELEDSSGITHSASTTLKGYSNTEMKEHHRKFQLARTNYTKKWGGVPGQETFVTPYGA